MPSAGTQGQSTQLILTETYAQAQSLASGAAQLLFCVRASSEHVISGVNQPTLYMWDGNNLTRN